MCSLKSYVLGLSIVSVAIFLAYKAAVATPAGYCLAENRFLSDAEFIRIAITLREEDWQRRGGKDKFVHSGKDFDIKNKNCCRVIRKDTYPILNRMFGRQEISVELNNETSTHDINGANLNDRFFFNTCGNLLGRIEYDWQGI